MSGDETCLSCGLPLRDHPREVTRPGEPPGKLMCPKRAIHVGLEQAVALMPKNAPHNDGRHRCVACAGLHGSINIQILCLEREIRRLRTELEKERLGE